ncbi:hypothetical protein HU719_000420 [Pseudomonas sp. SWRI107]|uniref:hypothetical protein n=1 Tax=Pseudomonas farsensis TaxID=2745492 RepID=UPI00164756E2|nr:hypothetical protein [Pseudomonas farsensis]MBV4529903.1 hypothetical protein [Pseudomonas farsensis]
MIEGIHGGGFRKASIVSANAGTSQGTEVGIVENERSEQPREQLSSLAKQIQAAAERAAERDRILSRDQLATLAKDILERLSGGSYLLSKSAHDGYRPSTDDPELLLRAEQATDFANGKGSNPFSGLSHEQLSFITYDEGGEFTVNERRAALIELADRHGKWTQAVTQKLHAERQRTGGIDQGVGEILDYLHALPPIEEAQILGNYDVNLRMQLSGAEIDWPEFNTSLLDLLANNWGHAEEEVEPDRVLRKIDNPC